MKKFFFRTIAFITPIVVALLLLEILLEHIPNDYSFKKQYLDQHSNQIELLYLGNSHIYFGANPALSSYRAFNAAHASQSLNYDWAILNKYRDNWNALKYIVIPVDYFSLYTNLEHGVEKWRVKNYSIYYQLYGSNKKIIDLEINNGRFTNNLIRLKSYYLNRKNDINCNRLGWGVEYNSHNSVDLDQTGRKAAKRHTVEKNEEAFQDNIDKIGLILSFASHNKSQVIFLTSPAYKTYIDNLEQNQLDNTIKTIKRICDSHEHCSYFNLLDNPLFSKEDFFDADHLNEKGAEKLTYLIDSLIENRN